MMANPRVATMAAAARPAAPGPVPQVTMYFPGDAVHTEVVDAVDHVARAGDPPLGAPNAEGPVGCVGGAEANVVEAIDEAAAPGERRDWRGGTRAKRKRLENRGGGQADVALEGTSGGETGGERP